MAAGLFVQNPTMDQRPGCSGSGCWAPWPQVGSGCEGQKGSLRGPQAHSSPPLDHHSAEEGCLLPGVIIRVPIHSSAGDGQALRAWIGVHCVLWRLGVEAGGICPVGTGSVTVSARGSRGFLSVAEVESTEVASAQQGPLGPVRLQRQDRAARAGKGGGGRLDSQHLPQVCAWERPRCDASPPEMDLGCLMPCLACVWPRTSREGRTEVSSDESCPQLTGSAESFRSSEATCFQQCPQVALRVMEPRTSCGPAAER